MLLATTIILMIVAWLVIKAPEAATQIILGAVWLVMLTAAVGGTLYDLLR